MKNSRIVYALIFILIILILFMNMSSSSYYATAIEDKLKKMSSTQSAKLIQLSNTNKFYQMMFEMVVKLVPLNELKNVDTIAKYDNVSIKYLIPEMKKTFPADNVSAKRLLSMPDAKIYKFMKYLQSFLTDQDFQDNQYLVSEFLNASGRLGDYVNYLDKNQPTNASDIINAMKLYTPGYPQNFLNYINSEYTAVFAIPDKNSEQFRTKSSRLITNIEQYLKTVGMPQDVLLKLQNLSRRTQSTVLDDKSKSDVSSYPNFLTQTDVNTLKSLSAYDYNVLGLGISFRGISDKTGILFFLHNLIKAGKLTSFINDLKTQGADKALKTYSTISSSSFL